MTDHVVECWSFIGVATVKSLWSPTSNSGLTAMIRTIFEKSTFDWLCRRTTESLGLSDSSIEPRWLDECGRWRILSYWQTRMLKRKTELTTFQFIAPGGKPTQISEYRSQDGVRWCRKYNIGRHFFERYSPICMGLPQEALNWKVVNWYRLIIHVLQG